MTNEQLELIYKLFLKSSGVTTDTRKIEKNQLFFALKGSNFNGNTYASTALKQGAIAAIIDEEHYFIDENTILVDDVLKTLQSLASFHRSMFKGPILALTGSNGKTTSKELLNVVLSIRFKTLCTQGNLNNHIGVPLTLLSITKAHEFAIIEMGANHQKEIASYCEWVKPDIGVITNIGKAHLEGFGGLEGVIKGKTELYQFISQNGGILMVNSEDSLLIEKSKNIQQLQYGNTNKYFKVIPPVSATPYLSFKIEYEDQEYQVNTNLTGAYNLSNVNLAIFAGLHYEIPIQRILERLSEYFPDNNRSQILKKEDYVIILDAYNANPSSMEVAIANLSTFNPHTVAFLGGMKELGSSSAQEHINIGNTLNKFKINEVILVGSEFKEAASLNKYLYFENSETAKSYFHQLNKSGKTILIKGSRGTAMEKIL